MTAAIGITTYNRPQALAQSLAGVVEHLSGQLDHVYVYNDGSSNEHMREYADIYSRYRGDGVVFDYDPVNYGVAFAKNELLRAMLGSGVDWCFTLEDDIVPISLLAVSGYINACEQSGYQHLSFAHHGYWRDEPPREVSGSISLYRHYCGAFCVYGRECLEDVGLMDERLYNSFEHVEHTMRLAKAGYTEPRTNFVADATWSAEWLREIPDTQSSFSESTFEVGYARFRDLHPREFAELFG